MRRTYALIGTAFLFAAIAVFAPTNARAQAYTFGTASFPAPGGQSMIMADFNGDGLTDAAVVESSSDLTTSTVAVMLGKPDGTFAPAVQYSLPNASQVPTKVALAVGDFNGDHHLDIIAFSIQVPAVVILAGNGDGTFQQAAPVNLGLSVGGATSVAVILAADFNGDGKLDLAVDGLNFSSNVTIFPGNGDGTFGVGVNYPAAGTALYLDADLNGDGKPDLVLASGTPQNGSTVSIMINNGDGTFASPVGYSISGGIEDVLAADVNGDGKLDILARRSDNGLTGNFTGGVTVLLGIGDGTFGSPVVYTDKLLETNFSEMTVADFNGDGKLDIATTSSIGPAAILFGNGDGTFQNPPVVCYSAPGGSIFAYDVNGDGKPDLVGMVRELLTVSINQGSGIFPQGTAYAAIKYPWLAASGDFDGDGKLDIAVGSSTVDPVLGGYNGDTVSVLPGKGDGTFKARVDTVNTTAFPQAMVAGDFNGDGKTDIVMSEQELTAQTGELNTWIGNGDGTFQRHVGRSFPVSSSIVAGDFNHDGKLDVAAATGSPEAIYVFLGNGDGTFAAPAVYATGFGASATETNLRVGDFNGDGKLDLAAGTSQGIGILPGNGDGTFGAYSFMYPNNPLIAVGDFNGDGKADLLLQSYNGGSLNGTIVALSNGNGTFQLSAVSPLSSDFAFTAPTLGDFDGDGKLDVAVYSTFNYGFVILFGNGDGTFARRLEIGTNQLGALAAADFNGDGALDLAVTDVASQLVSVFLNSAVAVLSPPQLNFAVQANGVQSPAKTATIFNPSPVPFTVSGASTLGDFAESGACITTLAPNSNCQLSVTFTPTASGSRTGSLLVQDTAPGSPQIAALTGTGTGAAADLSHTTLAFADQAPGTTSAAKSTVLTNNGNAALTISSIAASGDFAQTNNCGSSLAVNAACTINVTFAPTVSGARTGKVTITDNGGGSPQIVTLTGTGLNSVANVSPTSLTFTGRAIGSTSAAQPVALKNVGSAALSVSSIAASGDFAQTNNCGSSLAVNATCTINVTFTPTAGGSRTGTVTLTDNSPDSPQSVTLTGTGEDFTLTPPSGSDAKVTVSPGSTASYSLTFGGLDGLNSAINFTCGGAPSEATCTVNPPSVTPSGSGTVTVGVSVTTTAAAATAPLGWHMDPLGPKGFSTVILSLLVGMLGLAWLALEFRDRSRKLRWGLGIAGVATLALIMTACGGGGGGGGGGGQKNLGTPAGTYTLTVTGTAAGASALHHSVTVTLVVN